MPPRSARSRPAKGSAGRGAEKLKEVYTLLREEHGVLDVKFAFGAVPALSDDLIHSAVATALEKATRGSVRKFGGLDDSYGLHPHPTKPNRRSK